MRPQDLKFTKAELNKAFGKKLTRKQFLDSLRKQYAKHR